MSDEKKLNDLRRRFGEDASGEIYDDDFARIASSVFNGDQRKWPFADVSTLLDAEYLPTAGDYSRISGLNVALIGVPMDLGVTNRTGARLGPRAVRAVERIGPYEHYLQRAPLLGVNAADIGDVPFRSRYSLQSCHEDIELCFREIVRHGVVPLAVGGDHSITHPILRAIGADEPVGLLHIDAHCDTAGPFEGSKFHHGGPFRQAVLDGVLAPERTIQIGIRGGAGYLWEFSREAGMTVISIEQALDMGMDAVVECARSVLGTGPVYVSFDIDSVDPGFAPGTGTPEVGGFAPREVLHILRGLNGLHVVGADVVEVAPQYDATTNTAQIAAQVLFTQLCLAATHLPRRTAKSAEGCSRRA